MALSRKHFSFRIRLQQFYAPYGRSNAKESLNWPKRDYFYGSHWSLPPKGNESQNKWSNENTGTPSYAEWTPELKNRKGWYVPNQFGWLMNSSFGPSPAEAKYPLPRIWFENSQIHRKSYFIKIHQLKCYIISSIGKLKNGLNEWYDVD